MSSSSPTPHSPGLQPSGPICRSLAEKFARDRLTALAQSKGLIAKPVPEVLFVCVQNSGRSQMAAALTRHIAGDRIHVRSAGSQPGERILPYVARCSPRSTSTSRTSSRSH